MTIVIITIGLLHFIILLQHFSLDTIKKITYKHENWLQGNKKFIVRLCYINWYNFNIKSICEFKIQKIMRYNKHFEL